MIIFTGISSIYLASLKCQTFVKEIKEDFLWKIYVKLSNNFGMSYLKKKSSLKNISPFVLLTKSLYISFLRSLNVLFSYLLKICFKISFTCSTNNLFSVLLYVDRYKFLLICFWIVNSIFINISIFQKRDADIYWL